MRPVLFLLCLGIFPFIVQSNRLRYFRNSSEQVNHKRALEECNGKNESFVTLYDKEDAMVLVNFTKDHVWLGLRKNRNITWSDGTCLTFNESSVNLTNGEQMCEAIDNHTWKHSNCSERKPFMCSKDKSYTLVKDKKNWCQALQYCRTHFGDLVSIHNNEENQKVIEKGEATNFWIGLMHDEWQWEDKSCSTFRTWTKQIGEDNECTISDSDKKSGLYPYECPKNEVAVLCSKGIVRIKVIEEKLTWEQAFNYCREFHTGLMWIEDEQDQLAVEQWLNLTATQGPFWIGLRQSRVFGFWIWSDRTVSYSKWKDDKQPELPFSNHCGVITRDNYTWRDENCMVPLHFICEEEISFMNK